MKKLVSLVMSLILAFSACTVLVSAVSTTGTISTQKIFYENDFNDSSLAGKTDSTLASAIGWSWKDGYDGGSSTAGTNYADTILSIVDGGLKVDNTANVGNGGAGRLEFLVAEHEDMSDGVVIEYDFYYTDRIVGLTDAGLPAHFSSGNITASLTDNRWNSSWHVMPRLDGTLRNSAWDATNWLSNTNQYSFLSGTGTTTNGSYTSGSNTYNYINGTKYSLKITASLENGVRAYMKKATDAEIAYKEYSPWRTEWLPSVQTSCPEMFNDYLRFMVGPGSEVVIDNVKAYALDAFPQLAGYQTQTGATADVLNLRLVATMGDIAEYDTAGFTVKISYTDGSGTAKSSTKTVECQYAYQSISYTENGQVTNKTAAQLNSGAEYIFALHITNIPKALEITYEVMPYLTAKSGGTYYGDTVTFQYTGFLNEVPSYSGGTLYSMQPFTDGMYRTYITNTTKAQYDDYLASLTTAGYTLYSKNEIGSNVFATYKNGATTVHAYYMNAQNAVRILSAPLSETVNYPLTAVSDGNVTTPSLTLMAMDYDAQVLKGDNGAGFILTMADGSYVIIDGGWGYDTEKLYDYLRDHNKRVDGKILVRAWLMTHPHEDHYGNFEKFSTLYADKIQLDYFVAQFDSSDDSLAPTDVQRVRTAFARFNGTQWIVPMAGQKMFFGEAQFEFLYTYEMLYPTTTTDSNEMSLVAKIVFEDQIFLMTGDAQRNTVNYLVNNYGSELKCDLIQAPHHGSGGATNAFYAAADPDYLFVNTSREFYEKRVILTDAGLPYLLNTLGLKRVFLADGGYKTLTFPYVAPSFTDTSYAKGMDIISFDIFSPQA